MGDGLSLRILLALQMDAKSRNFLKMDFLMVGKGRVKKSDFYHFGF